MTVLMSNRITINLRKRAYETPDDQSVISNNVQAHVESLTFVKRRAKQATTLQHLGAYQPDEIELDSVKTIGGEYD